MSDRGSVFALGSFPLASGAVLADAKLVYRTYGTLLPDRSNLVLYPTSYGAQHSDIDWLIRPDGILDPTRWFVVIVNMFGNGLSTSPSQLEDPRHFAVTQHDNVAAQDRLLREVFGVETLALVYGWSMGAQQAYHWAVLHPERVLRVAALCGTARTRPHNIVFLRSLEAALQADAAWDGERFTSVPLRGLRAFARIYASWAASQAFYREELYRPLGYHDLEDYLVRAWEPSYRRRDAADLLAMLHTWIACDVSQNPRHRGDLTAALGAIEARTLVMPSATDLYFTPEDCAADAAAIRDARLVTIPSIWGHRAGNPSQNPDDERFIRGEVQQLLLPI
ncbi:MAG: homoserine acetyltransferase [Myxococcaceae bacterium]|nr:homoserine acetyltransferase [Myxococcaceae bacterium]